MIRVMVLDSSGNEHGARGTDGQSLMNVIRDANIPGLAGECGGALSCATCHVYVLDNWADRLDPPTVAEEVMLECVIEQRSTSRLTCQIILKSWMDGMKVELPASQY